MGIHIDKDGRTWMITTSIVLMLLCLFLSRALLSVSMMVFLLLTLVHRNIGVQLRSFMHNGFLVSISFLFLIPFLSGLWSDDKIEWAHMLRIKAPLLFFPLAFAGGWQLNRKQWELIAGSFLLFLALAVSWSLLQYLSDIEGFHEGYLRSKTILTPMQDDHVRFSWLCAFAVLLCILLLHIQKKWKALLLILIFFFVAYLHVLSARMGLFSLYIFLGLYAIWMIYRKRKTGFFILIISCIILLPLASWHIFPTFRNRLQYFLYDISLVRDDNYVSGSNDGARIQSLKAGWDLIRQNPMGVGAGDLKKEIFQWYEIHVPAMGPGEKFLPLSEWLVYGGIAGWIGIICLTIIMAWPFFMKKMQHRFFWISLHAIVAFSFIMDVAIEAQFGIFIYVCIVLWWWKWFQTKIPDEQ